jgi:hypothetical protein
MAAPPVNDEARELAARILLGPTQLLLCATCERDKTPVNAGEWFESCPLKCIGPRSAPVAWAGKPAVQPILVVAQGGHLLEAV